MVLIGVDIHSAVFLEVDKPQPVVLFEIVKGWLTGAESLTGRSGRRRAFTSAGLLAAVRREASWLTTPSSMTDRTCDSALSRRVQSNAGSFRASPVGNCCTRI